MLNRVEKALLDFIMKSGKVNQDTISAYAEGRLRFDERIDYRRIDIGNFSGRQTIIDETVDKITGECTIHQGYLPKFVNAAFNKIRVAFKQNGSEIVPKADPLFSADTQTFDPALRNGHLIIKQDGNPKLEIPISVCGSQADSDKAAGKEDAYELINPFILEEGKLIEWEIEFSNGQTVDNTASNSHNLEVMLFGIATRQRG